MRIFKIYTILGIACLSLFSAPASGRRIRESAIFSDDAAGGRAGQQRRATYIDTLNKGEELCLSKSDFHALTRPQQDAQRGGAAVEHGTPEGFRIQCVASISIETVRAYKKDVESKLRYPAYIVFAEPYYKLHIGDFITRQEAESALARVKEGGYKEAWIVRSSISSKRTERR